MWILKYIILLLGKIQDDRSSEGLRKNGDNRYNYKGLIKGKMVIG